MTYLGFLLRFLVIPIGVLAAAHLWKSRVHMRRRGLWIAIAIQAALALVYTTPWDNYLVAQRVWSYDPALVSGRLIGYVPIEEYAFFVLQTVLVALWWNLMTDMVHAGSAAPAKPLRQLAFGIALAAWIGSTAILLSGWEPTRYLTLIISWALLPVMIQLAFGADILWMYRRMLAAVILPIWMFLCIADALAIRAGTWTISAAQSIGWFLGPLPFEEALFFLATVTLLAFGLTLSLAPESRTRFALLVRVARLGPSEPTPAGLRPPPQNARH